MVFQKADVAPVMDLAKMMQDAGVDVWVTPRLFKTFNVFPQVPMKLAGKQLSKDGFIQTPLKNWSMRPEPDWFNPEAVEWVFGIFKDDFLDHMEGGFRGFRWPGSTRVESRNPSDSFRPTCSHRGPRIERLILSA